MNLSSGNLSRTSNPYSAARANEYNRYLTTLLRNIFKEVMALFRTWRVKLADVHALVHAVNSFPANTPRRWQLVSQLLSFVDDGDSAMLEVGLTVAGDCEGATMYIFFVFICMILLKFEVLQAYFIL